MRCDPDHHHNAAGTAYKPHLCVTPAPAVPVTFRTNGDIQKSIACMVCGCSALRPVRLLQIRIVIPCNLQALKGLCQSGDSSSDGCMSVLCSKSVAHAAKVATSMRDACASLRGIRDQHAARMSVTVSFAAATRIAGISISVPMSWFSYPVGGSVAPFPFAL